MTFITDEQRAKLIQQGINENRDKDNYPVAKISLLYDTYLLIDIDPDDSDFAFALFDNGKGFPEFVYVSLVLLQEKARQFETEVIQSENFHPAYPISVYARAARKYGFITEDESLLSLIAKMQRDEHITSTSLIVELDIETKLIKFFAENKILACTIKKGSSTQPLLPDQIP